MKYKKFHCFDVTTPCCALSYKKRDYFLNIGSTVSTPYIAKNHERITIKEVKEHVPYVALYHCLHVRTRTL